MLIRKSGAIRSEWYQTTSIEGSAFPGNLTVPYEDTREKLMHLELNLDEF